MALFGIDQLRERSTFTKPEIGKSQAPDSRFVATLRGKSGNIAEFEGTTSPKEAFMSPPEKIRQGQDILTQKRVDANGFGRATLHPLERPWLLKKKLKSGQEMSFLGTGDHHELYYALLQGNEGNTSPNDVLINFDSHSDISQDPSEKYPNYVTIANFVDMGFSDTIQKTWDYYIFVAPEDAYKESLNRFPDKAESFGPESMLEALQKAVDEAKKRESKVILTVDLDFFATYEKPRRRFNQEEAAAALIRIMRFVQENAEHIRLVHFTESLVYTQGMNAQVDALYKIIAPLLIVA